MNDTKTVVRGEYIEMSEHKNYLTLTNLVCPYNVKNLNNRQLDYGETEEEQAATLERAQTLCMMPVYAKTKKNKKGEDTFGSHEVKMTSNGYEFDTVPIGVHESVKIEKHRITTVDGEIKTVPCLIAQQRIWKRNKRAVAAIQRLFSEGRLYNSWEIETSKYVFDGGIKHLCDYEFLGNTMLGVDTGVTPAYKEGSKVLSVASVDEADDCEMMIAEALSQDIAEQGNEVNKELENDVNKEAELSGTEEVVDEATNITDEAAAETPETEQQDGEAEASESSKTETTAEEVSENEKSACGGAGRKKKEKAEKVKEEDKADMEASALTERDLRERIAKAYRSTMKDGENSVYIAFFFPADNTAWIEVWPRKSELDYVQVVYQVENDNVTIVSSEPITLVASPREFSSMLEKKDAEIKRLNSEVSELAPFKEAHEKAEHEKEVSTLLNYAKTSKCFMDEDFAENSDLMKKIEALDTSAVKAMIADKVIAHMNAESKVETSAAEDTTPRSNLEEDVAVEGVTVDRQRVMKAFLGR